jgi:hypothetical protein
MRCDTIWSARYANVVSHSTRHNLNPSCVMYNRNNSKSFHIQAQVTLARGWCRKSRECAKSRAHSCSVFLQSERWRCQYSSAYVAAVIMWLRKDHKVCETGTEICCAKWRGLCGCNPAVPYILYLEFSFSCYFLHILEHIPIVMCHT